MRLIGESLVFLCVLGILSVFIWIIVLGGKGKARKEATERAAVEGFAEHDARTGELRWLDAGVCRVVLGDDERCKEEHEG